MRTVNLKHVRQSPREKLIRYSPYIIAGIIFIILPPLFPPYIHSLLTKILIFAIFAMSLDIIMGYIGLPSLGHAAFFGVAGYTVSILLVIHGIENFWLIALLGILMAALAAAVLGIIALRVSGIYFLLVTFAIGMLLYSMAIKWAWLTRGYEGIIVTAYPDLGFSWFTWNTTNYYYFVFLAFVICFFLMRRLVNSPFGHALRGIRENEPRMRSLGYNTWLYKYIAFIIAGLFAGAAGVFFPYYAKVMMPFSVGVTASTLVMLICIIGGLGTLWGPVIGAVVIILAEYLSSLYFPERWPLVLGGVFVITVMFLRGGIAPHLLKLWERVSHGSTKG
jgi:branched-chain amino acid transport system permease protein